MSQAYEFRLPKEYTKATSILHAIIKEKKSFAAELLGFMKTNPSKRGINKPLVQRLVYAALEHHKELETMCEFLKKNYVNDDQYFHDIKASVLIAEMLWVRGSLPQSQNSLIKIITESYDDLVKLQSSDFARLKSSSMYPRYVRINLLKTTEKYVLNVLEEDGWSLMITAPSYETYINQLQDLQYPCFVKDFHFPELLVFPSETQFNAHSLYLENLIILQAKSSCVPVKLLNPKPGSVVLDMCAAPGMKTCLLAAHMDNQGLIHAVEKDTERFEILQKILKDTGVTCAKTHNLDALQLIYADLPDITHILVDPSCSGSGMDRLEMLNPKSDAQIESLSRFQFRALVKAMWFPSVRRIVYSTCSVLPIENEAVVAAAIKFTNNKFKVVEAWPESGSTFTRGSSEYEGGELSLYLLREKDFTTGFFVAVIERVSKKNKKPKIMEEQNEDQENENFSNYDDLDSKNEFNKKRKSESELNGETKNYKKSKKEKIEEHEILDEIPTSIKKKKVKVDDEIVNNKETLLFQEVREDSVKKKRKKNAESEETANEAVGKKSKKSKTAESLHEVRDGSIKKKKKKHAENEEILEDSVPIKKSKEKAESLHEVSDGSIKKKKHSETEILEDSVPIKKSKKKAESLNEEAEGSIKKKMKNHSENEILEESVPVKKSKKKAESLSEVNESSIKKKKKKHSENEILEESVPIKKSKKSKKKDADDDITYSDEKTHKKKKKEKRQEDSEPQEIQKKKSKKSKHVAEENVVPLCEEKTKKKKKKCKKSHKESQRVK